mgnify:CR=1 FL=1
MCTSQSSALAILQVKSKAASDAFEKSVPKTMFDIPPQKDAAGRFTTRIGQGAALATRCTIEVERYEGAPEQQADGSGDNGD